MDASRWANSKFASHRPHIQQNNIVQQNGTYHLNPAQAAFQPTGNELERRRTPRTVNGPGDHDQLLNMVQNHNIHHITEATRLDQQQRGLNREFHDFFSTIKDKVDNLEKKVVSLETSHIPLAQKQITAPEPAEDPASSLAAEYDYHHIGGDASPSEEMLADHPKEKLASTYLAEADQRAAAAAVLRQRAVDLCPGILNEMTLADRLVIEAPPVDSQLVVTSGFACCSTQFSGLEELMEHLEKTHDVPEDRSLSHPKAEETKTPPEAQDLYVDGESHQEKVEEFKATKKEISAWKPTAVREMPPAINDIPQDVETFSFEFLRTTFSGNYWSPGYYFISSKSILPSKSYWLLDLTHEPFLPTLPGQHGAKLTAFFNETVAGEGEAPEEENYQNAPVFIKASGKDEYSYFGNYSQLRFSDKLSYDTISEHVPASVLRFHAEQLAETGRPAWVTEALKEHFWPKPPYDGPIPTDSAINSPATSVNHGSSFVAGLERTVMHGLVNYAAELKDWNKDSNFKVSLLTADSIFESFSASDADLEPGLRLYFEYLECVGWDAGFYKMLVGLKNSPAMQLEIGTAGKKRRPSLDRKDGSTAAKMGLPVQATFKVSKPSPVVEEYPDPDARTQFVKVNFGGQTVGSGGGKDGRKSSSKANGVPPLGPKTDLKAAKKDGGKFVAPHLRAK